MFEEANIKKLVELLEKTIAIFEADRIMALENYNRFKEQLDTIIEQDAIMSEDGIIEERMNRALELVFKSSTKLEAVINTITKIMINEVNNESRERVAKSLSGIQQNKPLSFKDILSDKNQIEEK